MPDTSTKTIALQPGQRGNGMEYDVNVPLPYPIFVGDDNRCENVPGYALAGRADDRESLPILVGFQPDTQTQRVLLDLLDVADWRIAPTVAVGMVPVFFEPAGFNAGMFSLDVPITGVTFA